MLKAYVILYYLDKSIHITNSYKYVKAPKSHFLQHNIPPNAVFKCHRGIFRLQYSQVLTSYKLRPRVTEEYKQSSCPFSWCVRSTVKSWNRDIPKEVTEGKAA